MAPATSTPTPAPGPDEIEQWRKSVVLLLTGNAWCGGVVIDEAGTVATAYHCVSSGRRPRVRTLDGKATRAVVTATRPADDLALMEVPGLAGIVPQRPIRTEALRVGEELWAIGHPFAPAADSDELLTGLLTWSVSRGITSAVGPRLVQTDVALNPGNSGGPVFDAQGRIAGISSRRLDADNVAFIVPSTILKELRDKPTGPNFFGGTWGVGLTSLQGLNYLDVHALGIRVEGAVRDRLLAEIVFEWPLSARWSSLEQGQARWIGTEGYLSARLRLGSGRWSTTLDAGGGLVVENSLQSSITEANALFLQQPSTLEPAVQGRLTLGGTGLRLVWTPEDSPRHLYLGIDLAWPGVLGTF